MKYEYGPRVRVENLKKGDVIKGKGKVWEVEIHNEGPLKGKRIIHYDHRLKGDLVNANQILELNKEE